MKKIKHVSIIIIIWNNYPDTKDCITSLTNINYSNYQIILVDNGSTDNSGIKVKEEFSDVIVVRNNENLGYTGGCNTGLIYACCELDTDYCLILNNDTVIKDEKFLDSLVTSAESQESIGIVAPLVYDYSSPQTIQSAGVRINLYTGRARLITKIGQKPIWTDAVHGCAFLIKRKVVDEVGGLDDQFYLYWEETDFCIRVKQAGYKIQINPDTYIFHKSGKTIGGRGETYSYYFFRNRLLLMRKHAKMKNWIVLCCLLPIYVLIHILKSVREGTPLLKAYKSIYEAWFDFTRCDFGRKRSMI
ncbi:MAG: glycosyltransferase family 2 protein [Anaerolineaceae bacterium]